MARLLKLSEGLATDSEHSVFFWARLRLTGIYVLIVAVILIGFSFFLYQNVAGDLAGTQDSDFTDPVTQQHFIERTLTSFENSIILVDIIILLCTGAASYAFAGYTLRPIQRSLEDQRAFSEHASHELRTPLAVMKNDAEVLLRNASPTKELVHKTLRSNIEEIDRLSSMVANLLALARSQNHTVPVEEKTDIAAIARNVCEKMCSFASDKGVSITTRADAQLMARIAAPAFERVLINLLQNAVDHTQKGRSITVEILQDGLYGILAVSDTGSGIDKKDLPHVFERFFKGESASGSGLGLSIVKSLVEQHGGSVEVESAKGRGTKMRVVLLVV